MTIITLTTDFGLRDGYVAAMRGVILSLAPAVTIIDVTHLVAPGAVGEAAHILSAVVPYYPTDTIHLVVVDPGVGSARRPIALETTHGRFVGPDNGVFTAVLDTSEAVASWTAVHVTERRFWRPTVSATFHGRDIFAPVAAHLALGAPLAALGPSIHDLVVLERGEPTAENGGWLGQVVHVDHFGNLITNIVPAILTGRPEWESAAVEVAGRRLPLVHTYADVREGEPLAYIGSTGALEIAIRGGDAAHALTIGVGAPIRLHLPRRDSDPPRA